MAMVTQETLETAAADLAQSLERRIGRIRNLYVEVTGDRLRIRGSAPSYYVKQLALAIVQEALGSSPPLRVMLDIDVAPSVSRAT
jgi:hypothetical protein